MSLPKNLPECIILDISVFDNFMSFDEVFAKALRRLATCLSSVNNTLCGNYFYQYLSCLLIILELHQWHFLPQSLFSLGSDNLTFTL